MRGSPRGGDREGQESSRDCREILATGMVVLIVVYVPLTFLASQRYDQFLFCIENKDFLHKIMTTAKSSSVCDLSVTSERPLKSSHRSQISPSLSSSTMDWPMNHPHNLRHNSRLSKYHPSFLGFHLRSRPHNVRYDITPTKLRHHLGGLIPVLQPNTEAEVLCRRGVPLSCLWIH